MQINGCVLTGSVYHMYLKSLCVNAGASLQHCLVSGSSIQLSTWTGWDRSNRPSWCPTYTDTHVYSNQSSNVSTSVSDLCYCIGVFVYLEWRSGKPGGWRRNRERSGSWNRSELGFELSRLFHVTAWRLIGSPFHPAPTERQRCAFRTLKMVIKA